MPSIRTGKQSVPQLPPALPPVPRKRLLLGLIEEGVGWRWFCCLSKKAMGSDRGNVVQLMSIIVGCNLMHRPRCELPCFYFIAKSRLIHTWFLMAPPPVKRLVRTAPCTSNLFLVFPTKPRQSPGSESSRSRPRRRSLRRPWSRGRSGCAPGGAAWPCGPNSECCCMRLFK